MASKSEQRAKDMADNNREKPLFGVYDPKTKKWESTIPAANAGKRDNVHTICIGSRAVARETDDAYTAQMIMAYIKEYASKRGIVLTQDTIIGKVGVGNPGTKKKMGYGSAGQPGLLHRALSCVQMTKLAYLEGDRETASRAPTGEYTTAMIGGIERPVKKMEMISIQKKDGTWITRPKWKVIVECEIRLMAARTKDRPLLRKMVRDKVTGIKQPSPDEFVGLVKIADADDINGNQAKQIEQYVAQIRCSLYVDTNNVTYVRIPPQWDRASVAKRIREIMSDKE